MKRVQSRSRVVASNCMPSAEYCKPFPLGNTHLSDLRYTALDDPLYDSLMLDRNGLRLDMTGAEQEMLTRIGANSVNWVTDELRNCANGSIYQHAA